MSNIKIEIVNKDDAIANNKIKYNTNNHWYNAKPIDYEDVLEKNKF
jgi:hypothetical protein